MWLYSLFTFILFTYECEQLSTHVDTISYAYSYCLNYTWLWYSRVQNKVNVLYRYYSVITDCSTHCN